MFGGLLTQEDPSGIKILAFGSLWLRIAFVTNEVVTIAKHMLEIPNVSPILWLVLQGVPQWVKES